MASVGVAVSGGGHRASLFGLGVLLYLADAAKNCDVVCISSVSGGSLTNGVVAMAGNYRRMSPSEFEDAMRPFGRRISTHGTLFVCWTTWLYLVLVIALFVAILAGAMALDLRGIGLVALVVGVPAWWSLLVTQRGKVCAAAFDRLLFQISGRSALLRDMATDGIDHVICATDLHAGEHVYFSGRFVCSYRFGWGTPAELRLADAVQASAAFPGGFPCRWLKTDAHRFQQGTDHAAYMALSDGGVYDNMAEQWPLAVESRRRRWPNFASDLQVPDEVIVINGSAGMGWSSVWRLGLPAVGELLTLLRVIDVLYDNTTAPRRRMLVQDFDRADQDGRGLKGALVTIEQSPYRLADYFIQNSERWAERAKRAHVVIAHLGEHGRAEWDSIVAANCSVRTTLRKLGVESSARLLYHAYVVAMANLHVVLDYPLLPLPSVSRFEAFVA